MKIYTSDDMFIAKILYDVYYAEIMQEGGYSSYVRPEFQGGKVVGFTIGMEDARGNAETGWDEYFI